MELISSNTWQHKSETEEGWHKHIPMSKRESGEVQPALGEIPVHCKSEMKTNLKAEKTWDLIQGCPFPKATLHGDNLSSWSSSNISNRGEMQTLLWRRWKSINDFPATMVLYVATCFLQQHPHFWTGTAITEGGKRKGRKQIISKGITGIWFLLSASGL